MSRREIKISNCKWFCLLIPIDRHRHKVLEAAFKVAQITCLSSASLLPVCFHRILYFSDVVVRLKIKRKCDSSACAAYKKIIKLPCLRTERKNPAPEESLLGRQWDNLTFVTIFVYKGTIRS